MVITGVATYWMSVSDINQAKEQTIEAGAKGIAQGISSQIGILQETLSSMSTAPEVIAAVESNSLQIGLTAARLEKYLPEVMKIRIFPANVRHLDSATTPVMGNADLIMVQETLKRYQQPMIQGRGENRHLAMTAVIRKEGEPIGVILASQKYKFLQTILTKSRIAKGYIELQQGTATLAKIGDKSNRTEAENTIKIPKTFWKLYYWPEKQTALSGFSTIAGLVTMASLLTCLAFFISYRNTTRIMRQDLGSILNSVKELMAGKNIASQAVVLNEMKAIISTIVQYKRVLDNKGIDLSTEIGGDTGFDDFFDESTDASILDAFMDEKEESSSSSSIPEGIPVSLPTAAQSTTDDTFQVDAEEQPTAEIDTLSLIFKSNDIRGIAGENLTKEVVFDIGRAIGSEAKEKNISTIVVGRDGRTSSPELAESLAEGLVSTGVNILDLGMVPTPVVYFVSQHTEGRSGVVVTGSHNPAEYNGLKIIINGETLADKKISQLKQRIDNEDYIKASAKGTIDQNDMFVNEYIGTISEDIHIVRPMKVVVDCGNGVAGELGPVLLKTLGCEVIELFCDIDGRFPNHHPDPGKPENLADLIKAVEQNQADVGFAFDGDGDRLGVVDNQGKIIWPDRQMMLFAKDVLALKPGSEIIYDVKCSRHLGEQIAKFGGRPLMWKTGHAFMKNKLRETGASMAGEMSGHFFFNDRWFGFDDALYSASRMIEILSADTRNSDEVFREFPDSINTPEITIELAEGENLKIMEQLMAAADFKDGKVIGIDGMRVDFADGWGLVRASNTMPSVVLRFEANTAEALKRIQSDFKQLFTKVRPDINLPF